MKSVLKRAEKASKELAQLTFKSLKLISIKITKNNPDTGHFRLKGFLNEKDYIEIFEFYFSGNLLKYSYAFIKQDTCVLRYNNASHHKELKTFPHHKHYKDSINELEKPNLKEFVRELTELKK
ncbi:hypothetical protein LCGC14_1188020 [marine sediment metagenome]|uniref:Uncharacterized protein n=1 Tax=marine sediment metagenome TaxID=412755 RepID=A0A0F9LQ22_9ZZZZ